MKLIDLIQELEEFCPLNFAQSWDNSGLQVGAGDMEIRTILLAVDATDEVIREAVSRKADLILTHHPLLMNGTKRVTDTDFLGKRVIRLIQKNIACYAMHTNFDVLGMADAAADRMDLREREVLEVTYEDDISVEGLGRIGLLPTEMTLQECAQRVREAFDIPHVRFYGDPGRPVRTCAIMPGSGKDEIGLAIEEGADVMITGDITHHVGIDAVEKGISIIDGGHHGVEKIFIPYMAEYLNREFPQLEVVASRAGEPFTEV